MSLSVHLPDSPMTIEINVRAVKRARNLRLVSGINGVEAVVPVNYRTEELEDFISSKRDWIIKTYRYYSRLKERCGGQDPGTIFFLGCRYRLHIVKDRRQSVIVSEGMNIITFHMPDKRKYKQEILQWYKTETTRLITERLPALANRLSVTYNKVSIKNQRSRWASCSVKRNLSFNLLLAAAPLEVIDYVMIHELVHLVEMDHSSRFWNRVIEADPDCERHKEWLTSYSPVIKIG